MIPCRPDCSMSSCSNCAGFNTVIGIKTAQAIKKLMRIDPGGWPLDQMIDEIQRVEIAVSEAKGELDYLRSLFFDRMHAI